ncbi:RNA-splicing ligase RtcB [Candidatus Micrarchaeota archaeon CG11_big_fil_rev_8_21_14_0_20_47_5]|nr:MAG: RNA-splicing ligase RtcB [Candidatus Micrarchaeota archaeon CG11_big_fil_rev_8_21_14_0_20_47_5]
MKNISDAIWEIEKEGEMKVKGIAFGTEAIVKKMQQGRTIGQLKNVAALPGILKAAMVMPDGHEGYGFPIGGVGAFSLEEGIISPGGVGYDINCLKQGTRVLDEFGSWRRIEDFGGIFVSSAVQNANGLSVSVAKLELLLQTLNSNTNEKEGRRPLLFMEKDTDETLKITLKGGEEIESTADHPFLTRNGMKNAGELVVGDELGLHLFEGVEYAKPASGFIEPQYCVEFTENEKALMASVSLSMLSSDNKALPILAKVVGYLTGDGTLYSSGKKWFSVAYGKKEDMEQMRKDLERIGISSHLHQRTKNCTINTQYGQKSFTSTSSELHIKTTAFVKFLHTLGVPKGKKTTQEFGVPAWIKRSSLPIKRLYLAGLFGAELSSPSTHTKTGFYSPIFAQNKNTEYLDSARNFAIELMGLLLEFGIDCTKISSREEAENKEGRVQRVRLLISADEDNLAKLWGKIGAEYCHTKARKMQIALLYSKLKKAMQKKRAEVAARVKELKKKGLKLKETQTLLECAYANKRFIERHYYENKGQRITLDFESFKNFLVKSEGDFKNHGCLFGRIEKIEEVREKAKVYDFAIEGNHNFFANSFIVSNCGVRLITTELTPQDIDAKKRELVEKIFRNIPSGVGSKGRIRLNEKELEEALVRGVDWAIEKGWGTKEDKERCEEEGRMQGAEPNAVSDTAKKRGLPQFGTVGAGNHFVEIQKIEEIFDERIAKAFGLEKGKVAIMLHCGSRGFGHQVCSDSIKDMISASRKYNIKLPDMELCCAPLNSPEADKYTKGMKCAVNYAFTNRHIMGHWLRETFDEVFGKGTGEGMHLVYDVCHNIAKFEKHEIDGQMREVCVHRKGATRAFGPGREEIPSIYREVGQPVIIPGSMGTSSYMLAGTQKAMEMTFGSTCHGAGREMSRTEAIRQFRQRDIAGELLSQKGIIVRATERELIAEEAPGAYKDVDEVVKSVELAGISKIVAKLIPMAVVKG